jgi:glycosyltransferase involved in cell wall biosynthesis
MARIAFFTERLPPDDDPISGFAYDLMRSLADQGHELRIYSTYIEGAELPPRHPRIEVLRPFRSWSWLEVPRILPMMMEFRPEVLHLIQPRAEARQAMSLLPSLGHLFGRPAIVSSLYDFLDRDLSTHRCLLSASDAITVSNEPQRELLQNFLARKKGSRASTKVHTLPIPAPTASGSALQTPERKDLLSETLRSFLAAAIDSHLIFVPGDIAEHQDPRVLFQTLSTFLSEHPQALVLLGGGWGRIPQRSRHKFMEIFNESGVGSRVLFTGPLSCEVEQLCLSRARIVFLASLALESIGLTRILREALEAGAPLIMSHSQANVDALNWENDENSLLVGADPNQWSAVISRAITSPHIVDRIRSRLPEFSRTEAVDQPGNVISRIYAQILSTH